MKLNKNNQFSHMQKTHKQHRKVKWHNVIMLFVMICLIVAIASIQAFGGNSADNDQNYTKIVVQSGDSLWNLIKEHNPDYNGNMEKLMWEVRCVNRIDDANLQIGQVLLMPVGK